MNTDDELKSLLAGDDPSSGDQEDRVSRGMKRTQTSLGQQQTLSFILIKIWVAIAKVLAPFFAGAAKRHALERKMSNESQE